MHLLSRNRILPVTLLGVLLLISGVMVFGVYTQSFSVTWQLLPSMPAKATDLLVVGSDSIWVKAEDQNVYRCSKWTNECWVIDGVPKAESSSSYRVVRPCMSSSHEFLKEANPPIEITDCIQATTTLNELVVSATYVIDADGNVWRWMRSSSKTGLFELIGSFLDMLPFP